ncbi:MAG TPA: SIR2 family protein [Longimicrobium sp.]|nr:SIR2 family protein [Longimicrobium sp.]
MRDRAVQAGSLSSEHGAEIETLMSRGSYLMAAQAVRHSLPTDEYLSLLEEKFNPNGVRPAEVHRALLRFGAPMYITTNYDRLLEDAYAQEFGASANVITWQNALSAERVVLNARRSGTPIIFKIHGTIDNLDSVVLTELDYRKLLYETRGYRLILSAVFLLHTVLMLGFSFTDPEIRLLLETHREALKHQASPDYIFLSADSAGPVERQRLREDYGVQVIPYEPSADHGEVLEFIEYLARHVPA